MGINSFFGQIVFTEFGSDNDPAINASMNGLVNINGQQRHISKERYAKQKKEHYNSEMLITLYIGYFTERIKIKKETSTEDITIHFSRCDIEIDALDMDEDYS